MSRVHLKNIYFGEWKAMIKMSGGIHTQNMYMVNKDGKLDSPMQILKQPSGHHKENFKCEIEGLLKCRDHPNIITILDHDISDPDNQWFVAEYCEGGTIGEANLKRWTIDEKMNLYHGVASGIHQIHKQGMSHGHPGYANVFIDENRNAVIGDFASCRMPENATPEDIEEGQILDLHHLAFLFHTIFEGKKKTSAIMQGRVNLPENRTHHFLQKNKTL